MDMHLTSSSTVSFPETFLMLLLSSVSNLTLPLFPGLTPAITALACSSPETMGATGNKSPYKDCGVEHVSLFPVIWSSSALHKFFRLSPACASLTAQLVNLQHCFFFLMLFFFPWFLSLNVKKRLICQPVSVSCVCRFIVFSEWVGWADEHGEISLDRHRAWTAATFSFGPKAHPVFQRSN